MGQRKIIHQETLVYLTYQTNDRLYTRLIPTVNVMISEGMRKHLKYPVTTNIRWYDRQDLDAFKCIAMHFDFRDNDLLMTLRFQIL